ncbi:hypothetical protein SAMN04488540_102293 [Ferrimonas sediminum]|uniref:Surface antigen n=1 Tax=Ferrimonas sediminum TaxID=718193 RepID=A0A1G8M7R5_9GAMM|nr:hypothetical protein [Ferrimonas sediminum]SDI63893.1 hypothetical protein SAMN04488540_102293 [Ferrimonas sediminum]
MYRTTLFALTLIAGPGWAADSAQPPSDSPDGGGAVHDTSGGSAGTEGQSRNAVVPFVFSSSSMGFTGAAAGSFQGLLQPQSQIVGVGAYSNNDSYVAFLGIYNLTFSDSSRWFVDLEAINATFKESQVYVDGAPGFDGGAGGHGSDENNFVLGQEDQQRYAASFRYVLPFGAGENRPFRLRQAFGPEPMLPVDQQLDGESPLALSSITIKPFYESRQIADGDQEETGGIALRLDMDARNYVPSPSRGYRFEFDLQRDWGSGDRSSYTSWQAQYAHYLNLGSNSWSQQQTLSLTAYLADVPTWDSGSEGKEHRPPWFAQSKLGGWDRLRGYQSDRFHDRNAIYYGAEYRSVPTWQPQGSIPFIDRYYFPWWQFAAYVGVGRVHDEFDLSTLHQEMNWSAGFGIRFWVENVLARLDIAYGAEGNQVRVVVNQPF